jgi:hypothetical protein
MSTEPTTDGDRPAGSPVACTVLAVLMIFAFALPAIGHPDQPAGQTPGLGAAVLAAIALLSPETWVGRTPIGMLVVSLSVLANGYFAWGLLRLAVPMPGDGRWGPLQTAGIISSLLAASPLVVFGPDQLLVGYYLWLEAIVGLTVCLMRDGHLGADVAGPA